MKHCGGCNQDLEIEAFAKDATKPDGLCNRCRGCKGKYKAAWQNANQEKSNSYRRKYAEKIRARLAPTRAAEADLRKLMGEQAKQSRAKRSCKCGRPLSSRCRRCEICKKAAYRDWRKCYLAAPENHAKALAYKYAHDKRKYRTNSKFNLEQKLRAGIRGRLRRDRKSKCYFDMLGYTAEQLEARLMETMPPGYTWGDVMQGKLHIDHIIPKDKFTYASPDDPGFKACWALTNLQLLPALENLRKGNKAPSDCLVAAYESHGCAPYMDR